MPLQKTDPKIEEAVNFLPANGSAIKYDAWVTAMRNAGRFDLVRLIHKVRRSGAAVFDIPDLRDPSGSHTVRRAAAAAPSTPPAVG